MAELVVNLFAIIPNQDKIAGENCQDMVRVLLEMGYYDLGRFEAFQA